MDIPFEIPVDPLPAAAQDVLVGSVIIGLMPGEAISVAPSGMPVGLTEVPTCEPSDMPSGEVAAMPGAGTLGPICANAEVPPKIAAAATIHRRLISGLHVDVCGL
jgi:hypothetical protein